MARRDSYLNKPEKSFKIVGYSSL